MPVRQGLWTVLTYCAATRFDAKDIAMSWKSAFQTLSGTRRSAVFLPAAVLAGIGLASRSGGLFSSPSSAGPSDWPAWSASRAQIRDGIARLRASAVNIREFGARLDGITDDSPAIERAYASGAAAILVDAPMRLTRSFRIQRSFALLGVGKGPHIVWDADEGLAPLLVRPHDEKDPDAYVHDVVISGIVAHRSRPKNPSPVLVHAANVRGFTIADCTTRNMGLAFVSHVRITTGLYRRGKGSAQIDPAVVAGFSPNSLDDLNEDIVCIDNDVDNGIYQSAVLRFNFTRRAVVAGNRGRYAKISWWGGGAKVNQGGNAKFLRRVCDVYIADNTISGANGCIYGNNGQNIVVARNDCSDALDTAIDFEGCMDCHAYDNIARNSGNFCLSTFFVARNIVFERNYVVQDGSGAELPSRFGRRIGGGRGIHLVALRSGGFARSPDISVRFLNNTLVYSAPDGIGSCLPSYFDSVIFTGNTLRNVACDWRYAFTGKLVVSDNRLSFDRPAPTPVTLLGGSARDAKIHANTVEVDAHMPATSLAVGYDLGPVTGTVEISDNRLTGAGAGALAIAINADKSVRGRVEVHSNGDRPILLGSGVGKPLQLSVPQRQVRRPSDLAIPRYPPFVSERAAQAGKPTVE